MFAFDASQNTNTLVLINETHTLNKDYTPTQLQDITLFMPANKRNITLRIDAALDLYNMYSDMDNIGLDLIAISGYRNSDYQSNLFQTEIASEQRRGQNRNSAYKRAAFLTAIPGTSEHQSGLAIDLSDTNILSQDLKNTPSGKWLSQNCYKYGYILRYPEDKTNITKKEFEPWHFRYVGKPHAEYIMKNNITLEDYIWYLQTYNKIDITTNNNIHYTIHHTMDSKSQYENIINISGDNCGGYIITCNNTNNVNDDREKTIEQFKKNMNDKESKSTKNNISNGEKLKNHWINCQNYMTNVFVPQCGQIRQNFETGVENIVNGVVNFFYDINDELNNHTHDIATLNDCELIIVLDKGYIL